ncbi:hypothetical protein [Enhydrobacter aerosaccus]|uniref:hypothetical protein n=1 Tax=Enhydrobacter aerosaccus TaxID=225324 RepID=UPI001483A826|nr:hypothetical protein [Enhydrobacter aerosaccus]
MAISFWIAVKLMAPFVGADVVVPPLFVGVSFARAGVAGTRQAMANNPRASRLGARQQFTTLPTRLYSPVLTAIIVGENNSCEHAFCGRMTFQPAPLKKRKNNGYQMQPCANASTFIGPEGYGKLPRNDDSGRQRHANRGRL